MVTDLIGGAIRYVQGERAGMKAGGPGTPLDRELSELLYPDRFFFTSILIQEEVTLADVSFWQGDINFSQMKEEGLAGVIIRAGQRSWVDTRFKQNWTKAKAAGLPRGSYWFYDSRLGPKEQAKLWADLIAEDDGELVHAADFEESYGGPWGTAKDMQIFLEEFMRLTRLPADRIVIYTGFFWWLRRVGDIAFFGKFKLWLAWYADMSLVRVPAPWSEEDLIFWQYTSSGDGFRFGVGSREIDLNRYCCSLEHFNHYFRLVEEPPGNGETMDYWELKSNTTSTRSIRTMPDVRSPKLATNGDLYAGRIAKAGNTASDIVIFTADVADASMPTGFAARRGDTWRKVYEVDGRPTAGWIAKIHLGQILLTETFRDMTPDPEPPPTEPTLPDIPVTIVLGDDIAYEKQTITTILRPK